MQKKKKINKINLYLVSIKLFIVRTIVCDTVQTFTMYTTIISCSILFSAYKLFASNNAWCVQRRSSKHNHSLHTQRVFTQHWLNSYYLLLSALYSTFIILHKKSNEYFWSKMSVFLLVVYVFYPHCLYPSFSHYYCWFTGVLSSM